MTYFDQAIFERIGPARLKCRVCDRRISENNYSQAAHIKSAAHKAAAKSEGEG